MEIKVLERLEDLIKDTGIHLFRLTRVVFPSVEAATVEKLKMIMNLRVLFNLIFQLK